MSKIFITGISGMDGSNMADYMLSLGHEVHGLIRRHSASEAPLFRLEHIKNKLHLYYGDVTDMQSVEGAISQAQPDYIIHLAGMSQVRISFDMPEFVMQTNFIGTLHVLDAYRKICPKAKFYFAGSSECFGSSVDTDGFQRENTPFNPVSPYGISKASAVFLVRHYRRTFGLHACVGLLFNHTGARRGSDFVCQKIVKRAVEIKLGMSDKLELGNMDAYRDFGNSKDYIKAIWKIVNHTKASDFVIAMGETHSIRQLCEYVFNKLGMDYKDYITQNLKLLRPEELPYLKGDAERAKIILGWSPEYTFDDTIDEMITHWMDVFNK